MMMDLSKTIKKIIEADRAYYSTGHTIMTDQEYDALKDYIKKEDPDHPILAKVGSTPSSAWEKCEHEMRMGSLNKVYTEEDARKWSQKFPNAIFTGQHKLDGLSISLVYRKSKLIRAVTRGNDKKGEVITPNVLRMKGVVPEIKSTNFDGSIRAEILLPKKDFKRINECLPEDKQYSNPRNAAAGISRRFDGKFCQYLCVAPYDFVYHVPFELEFNLEEDEDEKMKQLNHMGFKVTGQSVGDIEEMIKTYNYIKSARENYPFGIDGVVIKVCSRDIQKKLGLSRGRPRAQIAWKFDPPGAITQIKEVTWDVGRTGVVTPLAWVNPVEIDGSVIGKATLHNVAEIARLSVGIGDMVMLVKAGDIIPKITSVIEHNSPKKVIEIPTHCPACSSELENNGTQLFCRFEGCPRKNFQKILNYIKVTKIDNFGEALIDKLFESGKVQFIADIYILTEDDISEIEGWGKKSAAEIISNIQKTKKMKPSILLSAVGIPGISYQTAEKLLKAFGSVNKIRIASESDIASLSGFSNKSATNIVSGMKTFGSQIHQLLEYIELTDDSENHSGSLSGMSFCFTGEMKHPRSYYQKVVEQNGGGNKSSVTKNLSYLVCNEDKGSTKSQKAHKYGVKVISEQEFFNLIGGESQSQPEPKSSTLSLKVRSLF